MMTTIKKALALLALASSAAQAQVSFGTSGGFTSITIASDINFLATGGADPFTRFIFEDAYSVAPGVQFTGTQSNSIGLSVNGNPLSGYGTSSAWGPLSFNLGLWDTNDFGISFTNVSGFSPGDIVTLTAGTAVMNFSGYLPDLAPSTVTMVGNSANPLSDPVDLNAVVTPEPASMVLTATGLAFLFGIARRKRAA